MADLVPCRSQRLLRRAVLRGERKHPRSNAREHAALLRRGRVVRRRALRNEQPQRLGDVESLRVRGACLLALRQQALLQLLHLRRQRLRTRARHRARVLRVREPRVRHTQRRHRLLQLGLQSRRRRALASGARARGGLGRIARP
jgi:hypothetical protein